MDNAVRSKPNHYDLLGLSPTATQAEINRAFAHALGMFGAHSLAGAAQLSVAFETLRTPARRRAYDASLGLSPEPRLVPGPAAVSFRISARVVGSEPHVEQHRRQAQAVPAPHAEREIPRQSEPQREPRLASFIASSLRDIARPIVLDTSGKVPRDPPPPMREKEALAPQPQIVQVPAADSASEPDDRPIDWRRPVLAVGAFIAVAGLAGALAGISVRDDEQQQGRTRVATAVPRLKPRAAFASTASVAQPSAQRSMQLPPASESVATPPIQHARAQLPQVRTTRAVAADQAGSGIEENAQSGQPIDRSVGEAPPVEVAGDQPSSDTSAARPVPAAMPLPNSVIARTIERIGYACGAIASATAVEGDGPGVYKISCTSGQSYQAKPVRGRYHFRRLGRQ